MYKYNTFFILLVFIFFSCSKMLIYEPFESKKNDYDIDNSTYLKGKKLKYEVIVKNGFIFKNENNVKYIELKIIGGLFPFIKYDDNYNQTVIQYTYYNNKNEAIIDGNEKTGLIENEINLWFHPPRWKDFLILNTNAYPYIINDKSINKWSWKLENNFNGKDLVNLIQYKKIKQKNKFIVKAETINENGKSMSEFIFNDNLLLEMKFVNFDKSEIYLKLIN